MCGLTETLPAVLIAGSLGFSLGMLTYGVVLGQRSYWRGRKDGYDERVIWEGRSDATSL